MADNSELSQNMIDDLLKGGGLDSLLKEDKGLSAEEEAQAKLAEEWANALETGAPIEEGKGIPKQTARAEFDDFKADAPKPVAPAKDLDFILDIPLDVTVEIGRTRMLINDLLQIGQGSVIELNRLAGEPLDILVNNKLIARGEVVVVGEKFGVRITDIVSPMERVKRLG